MQPFSILFLGLLLGIRHATDADHVVAVSTIVTREKHLKSASLIGLVWGLGHTLTILIVGALIIFFHLTIPPRVGLFFEFLVALALVILGILNLTNILPKFLSVLSRPDKLHPHLHFHGDAPHVHVHKHNISEPVQEPENKLSLQIFIKKFGITQLLRPLIIGLIHGLAGSAAIALLILGSISDPGLAFIYLVIFGIGTMMGMMLITSFISLPLIFSSKKFTKIDKYFRLGSGVLSLVFGLYLMYEIGIVNDLFGTNPIWDPH